MLLFTVLAMLAFITNLDSFEMSLLLWVTILPAKAGWRVKKAVIILTNTLGKILLMGESQWKTLERGKEGRTLIFHLRY